MSLSPTVPAATPPITESPCVKICQLDLDGLCRGCGRTIAEITGWRIMSDEQRIAINQRLRFRGHPR